MTTTRSHSHAMKGPGQLRSLTFRLLLICLLLITQQFAAAHAAGHAFKAPAENGQVCGKCVLSAQFGTALPSTPPPVACLASTRPPHFLLASSHAGRFARAFYARGPPAPL